MLFRKNLRKWLGAAVTLAALSFLPAQAWAGTLCATGTGAAWGCAGPGVANLQGAGAASFTNLGVNFVLADGLAVSFDINESITGNLGAGATTSAYLRITNLVAKNVGLNAVTDNIYIFSDVFNPAVAGTAGVGATGFYGANGIGLLPAAGFYNASSQAQMNYLSIASPGLPVAPPGTFSLTTPSTFAIGAPAVPFRFFEAARSPIGAGTVQLVGGLNFTLAAGSEITMPGSWIVDDNDPSLYASEVPEPAAFGLVSSGLLGLGAVVRKRKRA
jgi:hypothetical protein